jgi:beta-1,4-mannosyltransferase
MLLWVVLVAFCFALIPLVGALALCIYVAAYHSSSTRPASSGCLGRSAAVVVLGDIGRSPRMCLHVESLANEGWKVAIVGYPGSSLPPALRRPSVRQHHLRTPPSWIARLPRTAFIAVAPFKLALQALSLFTELTTQVRPPPEVILVQTPPALPTLLVVKAAAKLVNARVIIDWHNLAYTILALRLGAKSRLVRLAEWLERWSGRNAYAHLFVTHAMRNHLDLEWKLHGHKAVLHDRPPAHFRRATVEEMHRLMAKLVPQLQPPLGDEFMLEYSAPVSTPFTRDDGAAGEASVQWRPDRPALVVSSTSWTADEDFGLLLRAARLYEFRARALAESSPTRGSPAHSRSSTGDNTLSPITPSSPAPFSSDGETVRTSKERRRPSLGALRSATLPHEPASTLPKLVIIVTGKGELRARYLAKIARLEQQERWRWVRIRTAWLETQDYPVLLGGADIGVSLHTSSSGLDLPMKVVDMLGCGLPVCALDFACLDELVRDRSNGLIFRDAEGLARQWESLLAHHPQPNWLATGTGMQEPFEASTAPSPGGLLEPRVGAAVPMSPNPSMTLLHSPGLPPELNAGRGPRSTWSGNWKHVMRPLLDPAVPDQEVEAVLHSSALKLDSVGGILQRRVKQGYTRAPSTDAGAFQFVSQAAAITHESQKGLRLRKSVSSRTADDAIPAIQVSKPPTPP